MSRGLLAVATRRFREVDGVFCSMSSDISLTESDEGKKVIDSSGENIGQVMEVRNGRAYVDPDPGITDSIMSKLGWGSGDEETYELEPSNVDRVTEDEIHLGTL